MESLNHCANFKERKSLRSLFVSLIEFSFANLNLINMSNHKDKDTFRIQVVACFYVGKSFKARLSSAKIFKLLRWGVG